MAWQLRDVVESRCGPSSAHPQLALVVEGVEQFDDVLVVAGGQDVDLHHVVLQLLLSLCVDDFGSS